MLLLIFILVSFSMCTCLFHYIWNNFVSEAIDLSRVLLADKVEICLHFSAGSIFAMSAAFLRD